MFPIIVVTIIIAKTMAITAFVAEVCCVSSNEGNREKRMKKKMSRVNKYIKIVNEVRLSLQC
jgi:hypothetical protein